MGLFKKLGNFAGKAVKAVGKATSWAAKATTNPIAAASDLLQSGGASKSGTPKVSPINADNPQVPQKSKIQSGSEDKNWFMGTWSVFGFELERWIWLLIVFVIITGIFIWLKNRAKKAIGRRRTFAARRARVVKRRAAPRRRK